MENVSENRTERTDPLAVSAGKKARTVHLAKGVSLLLCAGLLYYGFVSLTGLYIPCVFRLLTGWKCPGCGVSHLLVHLLRGEIAGAFAENPFVFCLLPIGALYAVYRAGRYIFKNDREWKPWENTAALALIVIAVLFGIVRNLIGV